MGILFWASIVFVLYVYAGYPLLLVLLSRLRPVPRSFPEYLPTVTLLIAAYNEEKALAGKLENTLSLEYPCEKLQVLIAADGSTDRTKEIALYFANRGVELSYSAERGGKMAAINRAIPLAWGKIIVLSDANNYYNSGALKALVAPFQDKTVGATGGAKHIFEGDSPLGDSESIYWRYESWIKKQETRLGCATAAAGEIIALRRHLYIPPPPDTINDDFFIMMQVLRQEYRMVYVPDAKSSERISISEADEIERRARMVSGIYQAIARSSDILPFRRPLWVWQIISHKYLRPLVPFFMILAFASTIGSVIFPADRTPAALWLASPWNWIVLVSQIGFYLVAWIGKYAGQYGIIGKIIYLATFLVNSNFAALRGFWRYIRKTQTTQWKRAQRRGEAP